MAESGVNELTGIWQINGNSFCNFIQNSLLNKKLLTSGLILKKQTFLN